MAMDEVTLSLNGQTYTLTKDTSTGKWKATQSAPTKSSYSQPEHKYPMVLKATDQAGNVTTIDQNNSQFGDEMLLAVKEKVPPMITLSSPGSGAYLTNQSVAIDFDITDNDSGVNPDSISLQIDSGSLITTGLTKTSITGGYHCTYNATLADGEHTIKINAKDNDGNAATQRTSSFTVDTVPPELDVPTPPANLVTNKANGTVSGVTNDATSAPVTVQIKLNNVDQGAESVGADGAFSKPVTYAEGANEVYVKATDKAGKYSEVTINVTYDPNAPIVYSVEISPNPVDAGQPFTITAEIEDE